MVSVAKSFDAPIKCKLLLILFDYIFKYTFNYFRFLSPLFFLVIFPQDLIENGIYADKYALLGLGDIVIPGIFIALLLRFDIR